VKIITLTFGEVDEKVSAAQKVRRLYQNKSASKYAAEFQQILSHLDWDNEALADQFYYGLKDNVKDEISRIAHQPQELSKMIETAVRIDNRLYERHMECRDSGWQ
jgi:hypothetical protein